MKTRRKFITLPRIIILALMGLVSIFCFWLFLRAGLVKAIEKNIHNIESQGYQLTHEELFVSGFPFTLKANTSNISLHKPKANTGSSGGNWTIKLDRLNIQTATLSPLSWTAQHSGTARVDMHGFNNARYMFDISPAKLGAQTVIDLHGHVKTARFDVGAAKVKTLIGTPPPLLAFENINGHMKAQGTEAKMNITAKNLKVAGVYLGKMQNILGEKITRIHMDATIKNWPILEQTGAQNWQEMGGGLQSDNWELHWGSIDITGDFNIGFTENGPEGIVHIRVKDIASLVESLGDAGLIKSSLAKQVRFFLGQLTTDETGRQELELTVRDHKIKYGFLTLYKF